MMEFWQGGAAVVTGGASGLGAATAKALSEAGLNVTIFDLNREAGAEHAKAIGARFAEVDVTDPLSIEHGLDMAEQAGPIRIAVNCAGIVVAAKTVSRGAPHDADAFGRVIAVNLIGSFQVASAAAARMVNADPLGPDNARGVVVNTASIAAYDGQIGQAAYAASKGGVASMTLPMARDLADKGVRVVAIAPGLFLTPMLAGLPAETQASLGGQVPYPSRLGDPAEFASMVCHIVDNPMLNGEVIRLDGAIRMAPR